VVNTKGTNWLVVQPQRLLVLSSVYLVQVPPVVAETVTVKLHDEVLPAWSRAV
jgi:hypothetical protein